MRTRSLLLIAVLLLPACSYELRDLAHFGLCPDGDSGCGDPIGVGGDTAVDGHPIVGDDAIGGDSAPADSDDACALVRCSPCDPGDVRPRGIDGDCCPACTRTDAGCTEPPRQCTADSDCRAGDTCVSGFCGQSDAAGDLVLEDGQTCTPTTCWDNFDHYLANCCPSCTVQCGIDQCAPENCVGISCNCDPAGGICLESSCSCTI